MLVAFVQTAFCHCQLDVCAAGHWRAQSKRDAAAPDERRVRAQAAGCLQGECRLLAARSLLHLSCPLSPLANTRQLFVAPVVFLAPLANMRHVVASACMSCVYMDNPQ